MNKGTEWSGRQILDKYRKWGLIHEGEEMMARSYEEET